MPKWLVPFLSKFWPNKAAINVNPFSGTSTVNASIELDNTAFKKPTVDMAASSITLSTYGLTGSIYVLINTTNENLAVTIPKDIIMTFPGINNTSDFKIKTEVDEPAATMNLFIHS